MANPDITDNLSEAALRAYVERIERVQEDIDALNNDKSEIYQEAKANGFDPRTMRVLISERRQDPAEREEQEAMLELYRRMLNGRKRGNGTKSATRARAREDDEEAA